MIKTNKEEDLDWQDRVFLKAYLDPDSDSFMNATKSCAKIGTYTTEASCSSNGVKKKKRLQPLIDKWFDEVGLSVDKIKGKIATLMDAKKTKFYSHQGVVTDKRDVEALDIQLKATDLAAKTKGLYAPEKHELGVTGGNGEAMDFDSLSVIMKKHGADVKKESKDTASE